MGTACRGGSAWGWLAAGLGLLATLAVACQGFDPASLVNPGGGAACSALEPAGSLSIPAGIARWRWLAGTYWYVPPINLPALAYNPATGTALPVSDQTVWAIDSYLDGYFTGTATIQFDLPGSAAPQVLTQVMQGSITPQGQIYITFIPTGPQSGGQATVGIGEMACVEGQWRMTMQMSTGANTLVSHWAYMTQCLPGQPCYAQVPGTELSLPDFIAQEATTP